MKLRKPEENDFITFAVVGSVVGVIALFAAVIYFSKEK